MHSRSNRRTDESKCRDNIRGTDHDCDPDDSLAKPLRAFLVSSECPKRTAYNECQRAQDAGSRTTQIVE
jgi:hypothetical protein